MLRIISRRSSLALKQVEEVFSLLGKKEYRLITLETYGDRHKEISLLENTMQDIFTHELDEALLKDKADAAIHSAKDLPYPLPEGLEIVALTEPLDNTDSLVSFNHKKLRELPDGTVLGVSSPIRKKYIKQVRPDIKTVSIRGTIEERLHLIEEGLIGGTIVATCALIRLGLKERIAEILPYKTHPLQGSLAVTARRNRADMKVLFSKIDRRRKLGKVYLVGAGPGDPELLTVKADKILKQSDVIVYDDLTGGEIISQYKGEKIYAGKRKGSHSMEQDEINELLYQFALSGKDTVRLKGGDPLIFGRGGEELSYLGARLINTEVVPGITAGLSAAASAKIPLTMRGISESAGFVTAQSASKRDIPVPSDDTLVYYMGASRLKELSGALIRAGIDPSMPAALIHNTGSSGEIIKLKKVDELGQKDLHSPLIVIIGAAAGEYRHLPRVLYMGLELNHTYSFIPGKLIHYPLIRVRERSSRRMPDFSSFNAIIFTSKTAVRLFFQKYRPENLKIYAIGDYTRMEIEKLGFSVEGVSPRPDSDVFAEMIKKLNYNQILYPCSSLSNNKILSLPEVQKLVLYDVIPVKRKKLDLNEFQGVYFSSSSTVEAFYGIYKNFPDHLVYYAQGSYTFNRLKNYGLAEELIINVQEIP